jgi:hypothetical protein
LVLLFNYIIAGKPMAHFQTAESISDHRLSYFLTDAFSVATRSMDAMTPFA